MKLRDSLAENKSIRLQAEANTWQEAVKIGVDLLVAADVVEPRYYQAILDGVEQFGPYFVIAPGLAMPHGRPEEGVKKTGFSLVTLKKPLEFNHEDNDPVDILITMAAVDANTHQEVGIMQIVNLFEDEENFAYTGPEVTHLPGGIQAPAVYVLLIPSQLHIREYLLKPGRTDDVARVVRQLVIQRIGTAVAHDRLFREVTEHPSDEQRGYIGLTGTWRHGNGQPANNTILIRIIHTSKSVRHMFQK